jgi:hypothetical protein
MVPGLFQRWRWSRPSFGGLLLLLSVVGCDHSRLAPLVRLYPLPVGRPVSTQAEERAIELALSRRHWAIVQRWPGRYVARLDARVHDVTIAVNYSQQGIQIDYVSSTNLMYGRTLDGREVIHRKYNAWIRDLALAIQGELARIPPEQALTVWSSFDGDTMMVDMGVGAT